MKGFLLMLASDASMCVLLSKGKRNNDKEQSNKWSDDFLVVGCDVFMQRMMMMCSLLSLNPRGGSAREEHSRYFYAETFCSPSIRL